MASSRMIGFCFCVCFVLFCATSSLNLVHGRGLPRNHVPLFILGDSLFDVGNNNYINSTATATYWPYGETFFKYSSGRFSDGRLIPDFIAEFANLPLIPPYLQVSGNHDFNYGVNFASSGSGALAETNEGSVRDLKTQLSYFKDMKKSLRKKLGHSEAKAFISKAVYLIHTGPNDYGSFVLPSNSTVFQNTSNEEFVKMVVGNLTEAIIQLHQEGGRKFGILKTITLGCLPLFKVLIPGNTGACFEQLTELSKLHNAALDEALEELETKLAGLKLAKHELNISMSEITHNTEKYGFKQVDIGCCGSGRYRGIPSCGGHGDVKEYELCSDPNEYFFFDASHPTDKANGKMAELIWSGSPKFTRPYNLKQLFEA